MSQVIAKAAAIISNVFKFLCEFCFEQISKAYWTDVVQIRVHIVDNLKYVSQCEQVVRHATGCVPSSEDIISISVQYAKSFKTVQHLYKFVPVLFDIYSIVIQLVYFFSVRFYMDDLGSSLAASFSIYSYCMFWSFEALLIGRSSGLWPSLQERENSTLKLSNAQ